MDVTTLAGAAEWAAAWGARLRPARIEYALQGLRTVRSINAQYGHSNADVDQAIAFLEAKLTEGGDR